MKLRQLVLMVCLGFSGVFNTAFAGDPCGAVMCLSVNQSAPWECRDHVDAYFDIRVYHGKHHHFDPGATAARRYQKVMDQCPDAEQEDKDKVNAMYGSLEHYPFEFY